MELKYKPFTILWHIPVTIPRKSNLLAFSSGEGGTAYAVTDEESTALTM